MVHTLADEFLFAHALIHEAVYDSLLKSGRRELHRRAAAWFAQRDAMLKASHLDRAGDPAAATAYLEAAQGQRQEYRFEAGCKLVERGLELATERKDRFALSRLLGDIRYDLGDMRGALAAFESALAVAGGDADRCRAWIGCAQVKRVIDDFDGAFADLARAEDVTAALGLAAEEAQLRFLRGNLYFPRGDIEGCLREHGRSLELARQARDANLEAAALGGLGDAEYVRGRMMSAHARLRSCVDLCRRHDFGRLAVANHAQVAHTMLYLSPQEDALKEALAAAAAAAKVGHLRAELNARLAAMFALASLGRFEACRDAGNAAEALIERLGARRFEQDRLAHLGRVALAQGRRAEAVALLQRALEVARATALTFHGPSILGALALAAADAAASRRALAEAEAIIAAGCVGHNQLRFYPAAMQVALELGDYGEVERYAAALEDFTRSEPLPWSDFFVARGRALAAVGEGRHDGALTAELERLRDEGERLGLATSLPSIQSALAGDAQGRRSFAAL
jgi:tetratricopeptide (TPR) repeat protein